MTGWQDGGITCRKAGCQAAKDDKMAEWQDNRKTGCQAGKDDMMAGWQDGRMTGWQDHMTAN
jgi:hypothetical protein